MKAKYVPCLLPLIFGLLASVHVAEAQTTAFTYQGQLLVAGSPANAYYDFHFNLFPTNANGSPLGSLNTANGLQVSNGLFTVVLDFGTVINSASFWLEIGVRTNGFAGGFTTLSPRQNITAAPYSAYSLAAGSVVGTLSAANLPANVALLNGNANFSGTVTAASNTTTINSNVVLSAGNVYLPDEQGNLPYGYLWFGPPAGESCYMYWSGTHPPLGEFVLTSTGNISINAGYDDRGVANVQLGSSGPTHETWTFQYDDGAVTAAYPLGYSKVVQFASHYWNGSASVFSSTFAGFRGEVYDTNGDNGLTFYSAVPTQTGSSGVTHPLAGGTVSFQIHANSVNFFAPVNAGALTVSNTTTAGHFAGGSGNPPTVGTNAGAGNTSGSVTVDASASDVAALITLKTGSSPAALTNVFTFTFGTPYATAPHIIMTPASLTENILTGQAAVYVDSTNVTTSSFKASVGSSALSASTTYRYWVQIIQ